MKQSKVFEELPQNLRARLRKLAKFGWLSPMLATLAGEAFSRLGWLFEPKLDGERCLVLRSGDLVRLMSRNRKPLNNQYPALVKALRSQPATAFAVDGEIVAFDGNITSFAKLQQRMQVQHPSDKLRERIPGWFYVFDLLMLEGFDTRQLPLLERKRLLAKAFHVKDPLRITEYRKTAGEAYFREACRKGCEGIIAKAADGDYSSGRSRDWLKFKCVNQQEFVIGGYTDPKGSCTGFGALLVGYYLALSSLIARPAISETVVDSAVEAYYRPPIAGVPNECTTIPSPIARSPDVAWSGTKRLLVHRKSGRTNGNRISCSPDRILSQECSSYLSQRL